MQPDLGFGLAPGSRVLDVPCGTGIIGHHLADASEPVGDFLLRGINERKLILRLSIPQDHVVADIPLDGQVGGFACVRVVPCLLYAEPYAELTELYVEPAFRRRGLGRALIAHAEQLARARGAADLLIMTGVGNAAAQALYRAAGYDTYAVALNRKVGE
jgi:ribosomal protein S18 acetylase RimI-like enzyme